VRPRRPWFLSLALALAWITGVLSVMGGYWVVTSLRVSADEVGLQIDREADLTPDERAHQKEVAAVYVDALQTARGRVMPLAVAELLLGGAMIVFAQRATVGRAWARVALVQLTVAHLALSGAAQLLTTDLRVTEDQLLVAQGVPVHGVRLASVALGAVLSGFILLGLTLPRSKAFFAEAERLRAA
jgi:hypothetical protein